MSARSSGGETVPTVGFAAPAFSPGSPPTEPASQPRSSGVAARATGKPPTRARKRLAVGLALLALIAVAIPAEAAPKGGPLGTFKNIVVIYEENHSFDNLYGLWGDVNGQHLDGLPDADAAHTTQVDMNGAPYDCLLQSDINLQTSVQTYPAGSTLPANAKGPLTESCTQDVALDATIPTPAVAHISSAFGNAPYEIDDYIPSTAQTCPDPTHLFSYTNGILDPNGLPGGCTRDLVHRFYQEQYQINDGAMNRYITGSDSTAMSFGYYDTTQLPIYQYLHAKGAPKYVIADRFFQAAFGGSFLNHQFLVAAAAPTFIGTGAVHSVLDADGMVRGRTTTNGCPAGAAGPYPLYATDNCVVDGNVTQTCGAASDANGLACGDFAVNTVLPFLQPTGAFSAKVPMVDDTSSAMTIGDLMSNKGVSWAYYGGGWDNAAGITTGAGYTNQTSGTPGDACADPATPGASADGNGQNAGWPYCQDRSYQQHHYPFAYFERYAPGTADRATHLLDEVDFTNAAAAGTLPQVSFVKPLGNENEHPGYTSEPNGSDHLVDLIQAVLSGPQAGNTLVVVTYDEFGGQWDHVPPPSASNDVAPHDQWGPGTRIPALLISRSFIRSGVDHTYMDTLSIMRTIEQQWSLGNLGHRDATVNSLANAIAIGKGH
jgi:acid phosphatase